MRGICDIGGLRDIHSMHTSGQRFMPWKEQSAYLRLYVLQVEQKRLEKEASLLVRRTGRIRSRLAEIDQQMEMLNTQAQTRPPTGGGSEAVARRHRANAWHTFRLNY